MKYLLPIIVLAVGLVGGISLGIATIEDTPVDNNGSRVSSVRLEGPIQATQATTGPQLDPGAQEEIKKLGTNVNKLLLANRTLRRQLAETNRDLAELQFQVDSHSESFRPLDSGFGSNKPKPFRSGDFKSILPPR